MVKIDLSDILDVKWIMRESVALRVKDEGTTPFKSFTIAAFIRRQLPTYTKAEVAKFLVETMDNVQRRTVYTWLQHNFRPKQAYPSYYKKYQDGLPGTGTEEFEIQVITKEKQPRVITTVKACIDAIEGCVFKPLADDKPDLNLRHIIEKRAKAVEVYEEKKLTKIDNIYEVMGKLCEDFATGLYTITQACERHGLEYLQFIEIVITDDDARYMYEKAGRIANSLQDRNQLTLVDQKIIAILAKGKHTTVQVVSERHIVPGHGEKWIEKRKVVTERDLTPAEMITLKMMLAKSALLPTTDDGGRMANMTEQELLDEVAKNYQGIMQQMSYNPVANKPNMDDSPPINEG